MFNTSLTIVLPVHNAESRLRKNVRELLELASDLTSKFAVLIIDDGSTDATYEVAQELTSYFPQVSVRRHRQCLGLGASIEYIQRRVRSDVVIVHDGATPIDSQQVRKLWRQRLDKSSSRGGQAPLDVQPTSSAIDLANLQSAHAAVERAHRQVAGFQLVGNPPPKFVSEHESLSKTETPRMDAPHAPKPAGVGRIPILPRPKFLSALAEFALGE